MPQIENRNGIELWLLKHSFLSAEKLSTLAQRRQQTESFRIWRQQQLQKVLAKHQGLRPDQISLKKNDYGKPYLEGGPHFNCSHTSCYFVIAIDPAPIGIDIENCDQAIDELELANRFFTDAENLCLRRIKDRTLFYMLWTRKEAYLKALGCGFAQEPSHICMINPFTPHRFDFDGVFPDEGRALNQNTRAIKSWYLYSFSMPPSHAISLCTTRPPDDFSVNWM